jgi:hypothetical protein
MVMWNEKVEGIRLGDGHVGGLTLTCCACHRTAYMSAKTVLAIWPKGTTARAIARSLLCSVCDAKRGGIQLATNFRLDGIETCPEVTREIVTAMRGIGPTMARKRSAFIRALAGYVPRG